MRSLPRRGRTPSRSSIRRRFTRRCGRRSAKWRPDIVQLEFTQMAQYAADCAPARTILVEHDITYDLYAQMLAPSQTKIGRIGGNMSAGCALRPTPGAAVDRVVTMSEKDRQVSPGSVAIPNGVDLDRFQPSRPTGAATAAVHRLFRASAQRAGAGVFLREVLPRLSGVTLHVIAGQRHERFWDLHHENVEVEGFVADVRPAYERATVVIAPLVASAGTNIKILEAMAMGKAIVSTEAGINGLDLDARIGCHCRRCGRGYGRAITQLSGFTRGPQAFWNGNARARRGRALRLGRDRKGTGAPV